MKDLNKYVNDCKAELDSLGIRYGKVRSFTVNTRAKCRWGECKKANFGYFDISVAEALLQDGANPQRLKDTITHELLHTVKGCFKHTGKWKQLAEYVNNAFPDYNIKRTASYEELGIENTRKAPVYRYVLRCEGCGAEIKRQRLSRAVKNYKNYRCAKCGSPLKRII